MSIVTENFPSADEDPAAPNDSQTRPVRAGTRSRALPRAGRAAAAAATSRTAGWIVAAALGGSLVTLLLVPARTSPTFPLHRAALVGPRGIRAAGPGHRAFIQVPSPARIAQVPAGRLPAVHVLPPWQVVVPGRAWMQAPAMVPACGFAGQVVLPPGAQRVQIHHGRRTVIKRIVIGPGMLPSAGTPGPGCPGPMAAMPGPGGPWTGTSWTVLPGTRTSWLVPPPPRVWYVPARPGG
jgi:hypothetical protein